MQRINLHYITTDGTYTDIEHNCIRKLTPEQMKQLYQLYPEEFGTTYKIYLRKQRNVPNYKLNRKHIGKYIKNIVNKVKVPVIIGATLVFMGPVVVDALQQAPDKPMVVESVRIENTNDIITNATDSLEVKEEVKVSPEAEYQMEMARLVEQYCAIYEVDFDIVYRKLCELTDNFNSEEFVKEGHIPGVTCNKKEVYTENEELAILTAVRAISQLPHKFGLTYDEIHIDVHYESDESYEMIIAKYADIFGIPEHRDLAYGIWYTETGGNSRLLIECNNFGGLKDGDKKAVFANREMGGIEFIVTICKFVDMKLTLNELQDKYAPSFENDGEQWISNVEWNMMKAESVYANLDSQSTLGRK